MKPIITSYVRLVEIVVVVVLGILAAYTWHELDSLRKLPVTLPNYEFHVTGTDQATTVLTRGTWVSASGIPEPLHSTTIECKKAAMRCVLSAAVIEFIDGKGIMEASQLEFEVERWTDKEIVTKKAGDACTVRVLMLDLVEQRARSRVSYPHEMSRCQDGRERTLELVAGYKSRAEPPK